MTFPRRLFAANAVLALMVFGAFAAAVAVIAAGAALAGASFGSAWEVSLQIPRWYALFITIALFTDFLPLYIAHGWTRRRFAGHAAVTVACLAPLFASLLTIGYLIEALCYRIGGWSQDLRRDHLFDSATDVPLVFTEHLVEFAAWMAAGAVLGATYQRWGHGVVAAIPVAVAMVAGTQALAGTDGNLPFVDGLGFGLSPSPWAALAGGAAVLLLAGAVVWPILRDLPLRNNPA